MIYITGDTHGDMNRIVRFCERMETFQEDIMSGPKLLWRFQGQKEQRKSSKSTDYVILYSWKS